LDLAWAAFVGYTLLRIDDCKRFFHPLRLPASRGQQAEYTELRMESYRF